MEHLSMEYYYMWMFTVIGWYFQQLHDCIFLKDIILFICVLGQWKLANIESYTMSIKNYKGHSRIKRLPMFMTCKNIANISLIPYNNL